MSRTRTRTCSPRRGWLISRPCTPQFEKWDKLLNPNARPSNHWGALPFRVHQLFDVMVKAAAPLAERPSCSCAQVVY